MDGTLVERHIVAEDQQALKRPAAATAAAATAEAVTTTALTAATVATAGGIAAVR